MLETRQVLNEIYEILMEDSPKNSKPKWLVLMNGMPAGYPKPFKFDTRKEALAKANKLRHQLRGVAAVTIAREEEVSC